jgi:hypothetical protein
VTPTALEAMLREPPRPIIGRLAVEFVAQWDSFNR